jgi:hypothetical protein
MFPLFVSTLNEIYAVCRHKKLCGTFTLMEIDSTKLDMHALVQNNDFWTQKFESSRTRSGTCSGIEI